MKRQMKAIGRGLFTAVIVLVTAGLPAWGQYAGGSGTAADPYLIATAEQLNAIGLHPQDSAKHFRLTADIDMNDLGKTQVNLIPTFQGVFDGNDHTIANLVYRVKDEDSPGAGRFVVNIGLFRVISGADALVQDLGLIDPNLRPDPSCTRPVDNVGALVGRLSEGWVRNCYVKGGHVQGGDTVGGLVGHCYSNAAVSECWSSAEVSGGLSVGGLVGDASGTSIWLCHVEARVSAGGNVGGLVGGTGPDCTIEDCFTTGTVTGSQAGGLVGFLRGSVSRCYSTASLSGGFSLGGLVGLNWGLIRTSWAGGEVVGVTQVGGLVAYNTVGGFLTIPYFDTKVTDSYATGAVRADNIVGGLIAMNEGTLLRCYSTGAVTTTGAVPASKANYSVGGLVGYDKYVSKWDILGCFWDTMTSGVSKSAGGTGLPTAAMQDEATYLAAGWDFVGETANGAEDLWKMSQEGPSYPKLAWEHAPAGDPLASLPVQAHTPQPANGAAGQSLTTTLSWQPGREGGAHQVFFGTDPDAVANGTATAKTVTDLAFDPGPLNYGTTYYWRVDEVNAVTYPGDVWSFTTQEFTVVDDFESYNDTDNRIYGTWIDGYTDGKSGSAVGYMTAPFAEQTIVHGGQQSLPLAYDNSKSPFYSETWRYLGGTQDWTGHGATHLDLWFRGYPATEVAAIGMAMPTNTPAPLYLTVTDKAGKSRMVINPNPSATATADWTEWRISLSDLTGVSLTTVQKITLGVGDKTNPKTGGAGLLYFDDIGFGHPANSPGG